MSARVVVRVAPALLTDSEQQRIIELHAAGLSPRAIGKKIGRSRSGVLKLLIRVGLVTQEKTGRQIRPFSAQEDDFLHENYPTRGAKWCAARFGRSSSVVRCRAFKLGVRLKYKNMSHIKLCVDQSDEVVRLYRADLKSVHEIAKLFDVKSDCVYVRLREAGVRMRTGAFGAQKKIRWVDRFGRIFKLRSHWEVLTAEWLDARNESWDYEVEAYSLLDDDGRRVSYTPDFWIYKSDVVDYIVDVKGAKRPSQMRRIELLRLQKPHIPLLIWDHSDLMARGILSQ